MSASTKPLPWQDQPCVMGIVNTTPDSFSDGGDYLEVDQAVGHGQDLAQAGAEIIDIGGESTRPGAQRVPAEQQIKRVLPVVESLLERNPNLFISVDTTSSKVAEVVLAAGAQMINDVSAGREDADLLALAVDYHVPICLMHMQGQPATMQNTPRYQNVVEEVYAFLCERAEVALQAGVLAQHIVIDPGIGFGKTLEHNLQLLARLQRLVDIGYAVLLGASRKRFIHELEGGAHPKQRLAGSCATTVIGAYAGVRIFRVHDVAEHKQALAIAEAVKECR